MTERTEHGIGGSYRINPDTGERELVERTQSADAVAGTIETRPADAASGEPLPPAAAENPNPKAKRPKNEE